MTEDKHCIIEKKEKSKVVEKAYTEFAEKFQKWPNKYDIKRQVSKFLSDYALISKIDLLGRKVLNIGCSEPDDEIYFANIVQEWHAFDINEAIIRGANELASKSLPPHLYSKLKFMVGDATKLNLMDGYYDVVVSFSTIDHIPGKENRMRAISEMYRVLRLEGYLIVTVPNSWDFYYSYRSNKLQREGNVIFGYEYQFSPLELKRMLTDNGFKIIDCASTAFNPYSYFDRLLKKLRLHKFKIYFGTRFGFLAQKI